MCTLTFIPSNTKAFITHSRDEKLARANAVPPQITNINGRQVLFPRDGEASGSWVAMNENGDAAVLLNGGFVKHISSPPYRRSRGKCFLDIASAMDLPLAFDLIDLTNIEPFTTILYTRSKELWECRWDGQTKHSCLLDNTQSYIWSSVTLYDATTTHKRRSWFDAWRLENTNPSMDEILNFHLFGGEGDTNNDFRMNRDNVLLTVSITAMQLFDDKGCMNYLDLKEGKTYTNELHFLSPADATDQRPSSIPAFQ